MLKDILLDTLFLCLSVIFSCVAYLLSIPTHFKPKEPVNGKVVVITGASAGIGLGFARQFAKRNTKLVIAARRVDKLYELADTCRNLGSEVVAVPTDVGKEEECKKLIEETITRFGKIDVLVLNAGLGQLFYLEAAKDSKQFGEFLNVNFWGSVWPTFYALPHLRRSKGRILVVGSVAGLCAEPTSTLYCSAKHGIQGFFETLRLELIGSGVSITMCLPGLVESEMTKGGKSRDANGKTLEENGRKIGAFAHKPLMPEEAADIFIAAVERRQRQIIAPHWYGVFPLINYFLPGLYDWMAIQAFGITPQKYE